SAYVIDLAKNATSFVVTNGEFAYLGASSFPHYGVVFEFDSTGSISSSAIHHGYNGINLQGINNRINVSNTNLYANASDAISMSDSLSNTFTSNNIYGNTPGSAFAVSSSSGNIFSS